MTTNSHIFIPGAIHTFLYYMPMSALTLIIMNSESYNLQETLLPEKSKVVNVHYHYNILAT